jgi:hopene-associated glycosyltransferase HpnB
MGTFAIGAAAVAIWIHLIFFRGGFWRLPYRGAPIEAEPPTRSVVAVIPARDEATTIARAVISLVTQDYCGQFHVIVVDDQSSDGTAELARAAAAAASAADRLTICPGIPLAPGWTGKLWAMRRGVEAARAWRPDYLLFTDADIVHGPDNLKQLVARAETRGYDLVSLMVRLHCGTLAEKLLIPAFVFFFFELYPPRWVADPCHRTAAAAGGCMLIRFSMLDRIGGLDSIRHEIIDDCALARRIKSVGKVWLGSATHTASIREYLSWRTIWDMIVRSAFAQLGYSIAMLAFTVAALGLTYLAPPLLLLSPELAPKLCGGLAWLGMTVAFLPTLRAYRAPPGLAPLLPLIACFYLGATVASAVLYWRGRGGYWKGRVQAPVTATARPPAAAATSESLRDCHRSSAQTRCRGHRAD